MKAVPCAFYYCGLTTRDISGRCHHHRARVIPSLSPLGAPDPTPGAMTTTERDGNGGRVEIRTVDGARHRTDGPAVIRYDRKGRKTVEEWWVGGDRFNPSGGPTTRSFYPNGATKAEGFMGAIGHHREDGPAIVEYDRKGRVESEGWYLKGGLARSDGGPTSVRYVDGVVRSESWSKTGTYHRLNGPARISYDATGAIESEKWLFGGHAVEGVTGMAEKLANFPPDALPVLFREHRGTPSPGDRSELLAGLLGPAYAYVYGEVPDGLGPALAGGVFTIEGIREVAAGAPVEWVRAYESSHA